VARSSLNSLLFIDLISQTVTLDEALPLPVGPYGVVVRVACVAAATCVGAASTRCLCVC
jgi:hypothetical protein